MKNIVEGGLSGGGTMPLRHPQRYHSLISGHFLPTLILPQVILDNPNFQNTLFLWASVEPTIFHNL